MGPYQHGILKEQSRIFREFNGLFKKDMKVLFDIADGGHEPMPAARP